MSETVYNGFDAKLKVLSTEQSAVNTGAQSGESGAIRTQHRASSVGHRVKSAERSVSGTKSQVSYKEQSRYGAE